MSEGREEGLGGVTASNFEAADEASPVVAIMDNAVVDVVDEGGLIRRGK